MEVRLFPIFMKDHLPLIRSTMVYLSYGSHDFQQGTILTGKRMQLFNVNATFENLLNFNELAAINASDVRIQGGGQILQADRVDIEGSTIRFESAAL